LKKEKKVKKVILSILLTLVLLASLGIGLSTTASAANPATPAGAVFTMTNAITVTSGPTYTPAPNAVIMFDRAANGMLTQVAGSPFLTGGYGGGRSGPPDPLKSQGSLVLTHDGKWLLAVNAGSNSISVFQVGSNTITLVDNPPVSSDGNFPVSLTISGNEVFVLNALSPNISRFTLGPTGHLTEFGSPKTWTPGGSYLYTQVGFDNTGKWLAVSDLGDNEILVFPVSSGVLGTLQTSLSSGPAPFAFVFDGNDHLLSVQAGNSAVSSYCVSSGGSLSPIVEAFNPTSSTACWIVEDQNIFTNNIFTTNPGTPNISSYQDALSSGNIGWLVASAASGIPEIDEGITNNGGFLYALSPTGYIYGYKISGFGSLMTLAPSGFGATGITGVSQGLAAW
jgi:6-phosphogluconolactonase